MRKNNLSGWRWGVAATLMACIIAGTGMFAPALAHDDVHGRPHFKGTRANPTAVMRAFQADIQSAQSLAQLSNFSCTGGFADIYPCQNIDLLAFMPLADIGGGGQFSSANDIWGWTDPLSAREFALVGRNDGTAFVEITDPVNPVYLGWLPTHTTASSWRDIKVYANHAFIVSEAPGHGMQVFDLTRLLGADPGAAGTPFTDDGQYNGFGDGHNIVINQESGYAYAVGTATCSGGLHMVDISKPTVPVSAGCFGGDGYTHDAQCVIYNGPHTYYQGREICFNSNEDTLTIVDVTNKGSPVELSRTGYPGGRYTHQGWLTPDQTYFLLGDELDERSIGHNTRTRIFDLSDLQSPVLAGYFDNSTPAIDHNQYVKGNYSFQANYRAGLSILEIFDPATAGMSQVAYFDIYPANDAPEFNGAWGVYPFFDSGVVVVSGIEQGLFILGPNLPSGSPPTLTNLVPAQAAEVSGTVPVTFDASDAEDGPGDLNVQWRVDGGAWQAATYQAGNNNWTASWDTTEGANGVANGAHVLIARVTDLDGLSVQVSHDVMVANTVPDNPPTNVAITSPAGEPESMVTGNIRIEATAEDDFGVSQVEFFAGERIVGVDTNGGDGWSTRWNTNKEANGDYELWVVATDTANQTTRSGTITVIVGAGGDSGPGGGGKKCHPKKDPDCTR